MVNLAAADGAISCWNDKYYWNFWRPRAAIREAAPTTTRTTIADPTWEALFDPSTPTTPPLAHAAVPRPSVGSRLHDRRGHEHVADFFGTDKVAFDVFSGRSSTASRPRHFDRFSHVTEEVIDARVWGGIHFRTADVQGTVIGKKVAHWIRKHYFQPVG